MKRIRRIATGAAATAWLVTGCTSTPTASTCGRGEIGCVPSRVSAGDGCAAETGCDGTLVFALRDLTFDQHDTHVPLSDPTQPWRSIGLDLDGVDTTGGSTLGSCVTSATDVTQLDGTNGIDNAFGRSVYDELVSTTVPGLAEAACCYQRHGAGTLLVRIDGWNGREDDDEIEISLLRAADATSEDPTSVTWSSTHHGLVSSGSPDSLAAGPSWVADADTYFVDRGSFTDASATSPRIVDVQGYIVDGTFVAHLPEGSIVEAYLGTGRTYSLPVRSGTLWGRMSADFRQIDSGGVAGRMNAVDVRDFAHSLIGPENLSSGACDATGNSIADPIVDQFGDVRANGSSTPEVACDGISLGLAFHGVRAAGSEIAGESLCLPRTDCHGAEPVTDCVPIDGVDASAALPGACDVDASDGVDTCSYPTAFVPSVP